MGLKETLRSIPRDELERIATEAGTTYVYLMEQVGGGHRQPSVGLTRRLVAASGGLIPAQELLPELFADESKAA